MTDDQREKAKYKKALKTLTEKVAVFIEAMDAVMKEPSTVERGQKIAKALNYVQSANQVAMHFTLGYSWPKIKKIEGRN